MIEDRIGLYQVIVGALEQTQSTPVSERVIAAIDEEKVGRGLPVAIARYILQEGPRLERSFQQSLNLPSGTFEGGLQITSFSYLYSLAPGQILEVAAYTAGEEVVEKNIEAGIRELGVSTQAYTPVEVAETHIMLTNLEQLMRDDPTGFRLVDHIAYEPPIPNSPLTIIHQYPTLVRIIRLGAERYKTLYRAASGNTLSQNPQE